MYFDIIFIFRYYYVKIQFIVSFEYLSLSFSATGVVKYSTVLNDIEKS